MSIALIHFCCIFPLHIASAMMLSVCNVVGGCLCPIYSNIILMYTGLRAIMYSADSLDSIVDVMACLIMCAMLRIAPLFWGIVASLYKKKCLYARILAFGSLR